VKRFEEIIRGYYKNIIHERGSGRIFDLPQFELFARDYLRFAEEV
jgi:hypothetical protein